MEQNVARKFIRNLVRRFKGSEGWHELIHESIIWQFASVGTCTHHSILSVSWLLMDYLVPRHAI
jgi:hypothetical protein